ncbi:XdhC family protein [Streptomyces sp. NPDC045470]|uniref:XdhC family protein n=1 Tax=Streptomyces sp. NPDC045470 TaxID=3155469 RepID=UPI0033E46043
MTSSRANRRQTIHTCWGPDRAVPYVEVSCKQGVDGRQRRPCRLSPPLPGTHDGLRPYSYPRLTNDAKFDIPLLRRALTLPAGYVGAMGSCHTHEERLRLLREGRCRGTAICRITCPTGPDLGARIPEEAAMSVAADIIARANGASGLPLSSHTSPTHRAAAEILPTTSTLIECFHNTYADGRCCVWHRGNSPLNAVRSGCLGDAGVQVGQLHASVSWCSAHSFRSARTADRKRGRSTGRLREDARAARECDQSERPDDRRESGRLGNRRCRR